MILLAKLFEVLFPVFLTIGIGYWYGKKDPKFNTKFITAFAGNFGLPAIIFYSLTTTNINMELFLRFSYYITLYVIIFSIIGLIILKILNKDIYRLLPPLILPNTGNMGVPICLFAYGSEGLGVSASITSLIILFHFTLGVFLADRKFNLHVILKNPPFYSILFSALILYNDINLPIFIINTTEWLMFATIFLILMSLGIALTRLKVFSLTNALISSFVRMILGPIIGLLIIFYFDLSGFAAGVLLIQCSMPSAVLNYLVASIYSPKKIVDSVASTIVVSTLMSFITLPIVVYFALRYFS